MAKGTEGGGKTVVEQHMGVGEAGHKLQDVQGGRGDGEEGEKEEEAGKKKRRKHWEERGKHREGDPKIDWWMDERMMMNEWMVNTRGWGEGQN